MPEQLPVVRQADISFRRLYRIICLLDSIGNQVIRIKCQPFPNQSFQKKDMESG